MDQILEKVYAVYGNKLPDRLLYNSMKNKPVSVAGILSKFKKWARFELSYTEFCITKRPKVEVKTKPMAAKVTKKQDV